MAASATVRSQLAREHIPPELRAPGTMQVRPRLARLVAAPPEQIAEGVWLIRGGLFRSMNVYLIEDGDGVVLFDAGESDMAPAIAIAAARLGGIKRIVLGHADFDHRGSAPALSAAPVHCHPDAIDEAEGSGGRSYMRFDKLPPWIRPLYGFLPDMWDGGPVKVSGTVREGDEVAGFEVLELPGHAPGLIGLWRAADPLALVSALNNTLYHWGMVILPLGYTVREVFAAGGNPHGTSYTSGHQVTGPDASTLDVARYQGQRLARYATVIAEARSRGAFAVRRPSPETFHGATLTGAAAEVRRR
jgi:hydroxyacylglutathione hydrolase